ncbi:organic cation transporter protein isoform X2 [Leptinotarsa decemlineata]|uniref:organic cation transporter protein isoform X2 n=1 Tax=Leptinotarsa decemlineata TaxID=7539 RepID=UPI003D30CB56
MDIRDPNEEHSLLQIREVQNGNEKPPEPKEIEEDTDIIEKSIGVLGRWHIWVCFVIFLVKFPVAWHQLSIVFVAPRVDVYCIDNNTDVCSKNCQNYLFNTSIFTQTIATEWNLICDKEYLVKLAQTVTMLGILFGNMIFGYLSDRFGRRNPLVCAVIIQGMCGLSAAFSPWFSLFLVMRFLAALATGGTMITSFVLIMEIVGTQWRTVVGILYQIPFNLGHLLMPLISYYQRDWRSFQAAISAPSLALIIYFWILPESPRWQLAMGNKESALKTLKNAAECNKLPTEKIEENVDSYLECRKEKQTGQRKANILDLVRTPIMRMYTIAVGFNWLVCGLCFFGVSQFIGQIAGNIFINVAISAVIQVPGTLVACWITKAWGRKKTLIFADIVAGLSVLAIVLVPANTPWVTTTLASIGMFGLALSFPTVYIYSGELYPTVVRNLGVGTSSMFARIGSMVAPFIATLDTVEPWIPPIIFGIIPLIGAVLCCKLPETLDCNLPDTIEEAEEFDKRKIKKTNDDTEMK